MNVKHIAVFGLATGALIAIGLLTPAQWHAIGALVQALVVRYGAILFPWVLASLFGRLWWKERQRAELYGDIAISEQEQRQQLNAQLWKAARALEQRPAQRKRATR